MVNGEWSMISSQGPFTIDHSRKLNSEQNPSGLRPQVSNKLCLFLTCALGRQRQQLMNRPDSYRAVAVQESDATVAQPGPQSWYQKIKQQP